MKFKISLNENIKSFFNDSIIYGLVGIINKAIPFLLLPVLIRWIDKEQYGMYSLFVTAENFIFPILSLNLYSALSKHYYLKINLSKYISTIFFVSFIILIVSLLIIFFIPSSLFNYSGFTKSTFVFIVINSSILGIFNLQKTTFRLQRKPYKFGVYVISFSLILVNCLLVFGYLWRNAEMLIIARVTSYIVMFLISIFMLKKAKLIDLSFNFYMLKRIIKFSAPTIIFSLSALIFSSSDRFFIQYFLGLESVGTYVAIFQLSSIFTMLAVSLNSAWIPWLFENLNKNNNLINTQIVRLTYFLTFSSILIGFLFIILFPLISSMILTADYFSDIYIATPLIIGFVFQGFYFLYSPYIFYTENTMSNGLMGLITAAVNIILNIILIPKYGIIGAAYSSMFSWIILTVMAIYLSNKFYKMPWLSTYKLKL